MRIVREFPPYNQRRYGKPWIARVIGWPVGRPAVLEWGSALDAWTCEIEASPGDVIRWGQRDHRGNGTTALFGVVQADGGVEVCDAVHAASVYRYGWQQEALQKVVEAHTP